MTTGLGEGNIWGMANIEREYSIPDEPEERGVVLIDRFDGEWERHPEPRYWQNETTGQVWEWSELLFQRGPLREKR